MNGLIIDAVQELNPRISLSLLIYFVDKCEGRLHTTALMGTEGQLSGFNSLLLSCDPRAASSLPAEPSC